MRLQSSSEDLALPSWCSQKGAAHPTGLRCCWLWGQRSSVSSVCSCWMLAMSQPLFHQSSWKLTFLACCFLPHHQSSVTHNQRRIKMLKIFLLLTNHSGLSEKPWKSHKSWSGMDLLCSNRKYTVDYGCISHTWKKREECMHGALWRGSDSTWWNQWALFIAMMH